MKNLPLHQEHQKLGARFISVAGWEIPARYGDPIEEYRVVRQGAGLLDQSFRGKLRLRGKDRIEFLHGMVTNDVQRLAPGQGCYAAITTAKAKMLADCRIYCLADSLLLDLEPEVVSKITQHLDRYIIASDVTIEDLTGTWGLLSVYGPESSDRLMKGLALSRPPNAEYDCLESSFQSKSLIIARNEITGEVGYDLFIPVEGLPSLFEALLQAGAAPVGHEALDILRIEAGIPRYGVDMDESHFPMEAGLSERAISFTKGCYIGQETIARADTQGRMNRYLTGLELKADAVPGKGRLIFKDERSIGVITSAIRSPRLGKVIALGYLQRDFAKQDMEVSVDDGENRLPAAVTALPFYRRNQSP